MFVPHLLCGRFRRWRRRRIIVMVRFCRFFFVLLLQEPVRLFFHNSKLLSKHCKLPHRIIARAIIHCNEVFRAASRICEDLAHTVL